MICFILFKTVVDLGIFFLLLMFVVYSPPIFFLLSSLFPIFEHFLQKSPNIYNFCLQFHCPGYIQLRQVSVHLTGPAIALTAL